MQVAGCWLEFQVRANGQRETDFVKKNKTTTTTTTTTASRHFTASRRPQIVPGNCFLQEPMGSRLATSRLELDFATGAL